MPTFGFFRVDQVIDDRLLGLSARLEMFSVNALDFEGAVEQFHRRVDAPMSSSAPQ
jgi:hypothetical protein